MLKAKINLPESSDGDKYVVFKPSRTGLGDRLRALCVAALYAELSGRKLCVDWRDGLYGPKGVNIFSRLFHVVNIDVVEPADLPADDVFPEAWARRLDLSLEDVYDLDGWPKWDREAVVKRYQVDLRNIHHPARVVVVWEFTRLSELSPFCPAYLMSADIDTFERRLFKRYLTFSDDISQRVMELIGRYGDGLIGVHVRASNEFFLDKGVNLDLSSYHRAIEKAKRKAGCSKIYVATDNREVLSNFRDVYGDVLSLEKWFPDPGDPIHLAGSSLSERFSMARDAATELAALAYAKAIVANDVSSYARAAKGMSEAPLAMHFDVRNFERRSLFGRVVKGIRKRARRFLR